VQNSTEVGYNKRPLSGGFLFDQRHRTCPGPDMLTDAVSSFPYYYFATIVVAMFGWIWLLVLIVRLLLPSV